jgi:hypothetical protein
MRVSGRYCRQKHALYRWKGTSTRCATVLSDSIGKWFRFVRYTDIQAIPGVNLRRAAQCIRDHTLNVRDYRLIIIMIATNDVERLTIASIVQNLSELVDAIRNENPKARIAYNAIIFRPKDIPEQMEQLKSITDAKSQSFAVPIPFPTTFIASNPPIPTTPGPVLTNQQIYAALPLKEKKRRQTNKAIRYYCKDAGICFLESWKCLQLADRTVNLEMYAPDGLHLNDEGILTLRNYIEGNVSTLLDPNKQLLWYGKVSHNPWWI